MGNPYAPPDPDRVLPDRPPQERAPRPLGALGAPSPRPGPDPTPRTPADAAGEARASGSARTAFQLILAALVVAILPEPWNAASLAFSVAALVLAVRSLVTALRAHARNQLVLLGMLLAASSMLGLGLGAITLLPVSNPYTTYRQCMTSALTVQARNTCQAELTRQATPGGQTATNAG